MKKIPKWAILLGYCLPFTFLGMYGDAVWGTMWLYVVEAAGLGALCFFTIRRRSIPTLLLGNLLTGAASYLCTALVLTPYDNGYFKPFTACGLAIAESILALALQLLAVWVWYPRKNER